MITLYIVVATYVGMQNKKGCYVWDIDRALLLSKYIYKVYILLTGGVKGVR